MNEFKNATYIGERALFGTNGANIFRCVFEDGESPLKECRNIQLSGVSFQWKYPLWYCSNVDVKNSSFLEYFLKPFSNLITTYIILLSFTKASFEI